MALSDGSVYHWQTKVEVFVEPTAYALQHRLNEFYAERFTIATQIFPAADERSWTAFVHYKVRV